MERAAVKAELIKMLEDETGETMATLDDSTQIVETFGFDSADMVSLIMNVESQFRIRLTQDELIEATTVGLLIDLIEAKLAQPCATKAA